MSAKTQQGSAASRVFVVVAVSAAVIVAALAAVLVLDAERSERNEAEEVTRAVASALASLPEVAESLSAPDPSEALQPLAADVMAQTGLDFVTIMTPDGIRVSHRDPAEIGRHYLGTIPSTPSVFTEEFTGTLGPSVRTIVPVTTGGELVGWVSVGVTIGSIWSKILPRLPFVVSIALALLAAGLVGAWLARRTTRRVAGDLPAGTIRDAVASYESVRTLGEALRAQTHEHGNRMHTAVSLLELGRTGEAIEILTETSRQSQELVDQVAARRGGDPTVGALLLGKAAQARERGIEWSAEIDPDAPRSVLSPVDAVSVVGNLIDNAMDAAAAAEAPRWVRVVFGRTPSSPASLRMEVSDSGTGVPAALRERIYEHGFTTKPGGAEGRGVGLALVRSIVASAGGQLELRDDPTVFVVTLPARAT
ncbi:sensor histidine kinase regulating citrate/malate metabolism [Microbacterium trichothecenolyticum]|uniref:sensor histidine kinase n=1 Tax=Microbacterium trichothecenolyticum TaxID=69370 RepID=UPI002866B6A7|nr:ATP-binding protein [Microbacterium trichothecenolyticum]MDR7185631.1 sensor histidine kinase regulating citrate/malate metabolism [Microbacterium trichothecenolyticum]